MIHPKRAHPPRLASVKSYSRPERKSVKMTIVGWPLYSEFEVDKSLSGNPSSGVLRGLLKEFGGSVEAETTSPVRYGKKYDGWALD
jgi:hypothetical protein